MTEYVKLLLLWLFAWIALAAALNAAVDPYGIFEFTRIQGFNDIKSRGSQRGLMLRRQLISSIAPRALIVGNSRAEVGFDPENSAWLQTIRPVVNAAVPGAGTGTARKLVEHAVSSGDLRVIVAGIDFLDFRVKAADGVDQAFAPRMISFDIGEPQRWDIGIKDYAEALLSMDALYDSAATLIAQRNQFAPRVTRYGFNPMSDYVQIAAVEGYGTLFLQRDRENAITYLRGGKSIVSADGELSQAFRDLRRLVGHALANGSDLHLVIYPYHAHVLELFRLTGLWGAFEQWKRAVVMLVEEAASGNNVVKGRVTLWDFSGYSDYSTEPVPQVGDKQTSVRWYWEAGHFKKELGDVVLKKILSGAIEGSSQGVEGFGVVISSKNIEGHLISIAASGERYRQSRYKEVQALSTLVERLKANQP